jgi:hypothetical protein
MPAFSDDRRLAGRLLHAMSLLAECGPCFESGAAPRTEPGHEEAARYWNITLYIGLTLRSRHG